MLDTQKDIVNQTFDSKNVKAFFLPKYTVIELHPKVLHFSPSKTMDSGFKCGIVLPMGTNTAFVKAEKTNTEEDRLLFKTNKWILVHQEHQKND